VFRWGGSYSKNKDAMHFEVVCSPANLATGVRTDGLRPNPGDEPMNQDVVDALLRGSADAGEAKNATARLEGVVEDLRSDLRAAEAENVKLRRQVDVLRRGLVPENSDDWQDVTPMDGLGRGTRASNLLRFAREAAVASRPETDVG
jgi:hypothetical protein